ncbi:DUF2189 domain-containing protein [Oleomonas cavernae]|uniref:DUF2189 domain-containing protein n=1 Tax=Oleomonas cavernae TaxID=2320859 RepID=A0A418WEZ7_9PROT|nr:DUF2189 domain-containing protein [Oleomonas cavernae]RJF88595.1 DUF2189 domain-containing protein [Oleomonas cavernae]
MTIRNPVEWGADLFTQTSRAVGSASHAIYHDEEDANLAAPAIRKIGLADLRDALRKGFADFGAYRTDVIFLCVVYPIIGLVLGRAAVTQNMLPLVFPLASGFALIGPLAGVGLYEMSRQREHGATVNWLQAFAVLRSPSFAAIALLGATLVALFALWLYLAQVIYDQTLGPLPPVSIEAFISALLTTSAGWTMIGVGTGVGFVFAVVVLAISVVSFPMLLERKVRADTAAWTSIRAVAANPVPMAAWGLIVAGSLVLGSIPVFIGLVVVLPVLGHATWHLYRKVLEPL